MADGNSNVSDAFAKQVFDAIEAVRSTKKHPYCVSIHSYITRHNATNSDKKGFQEAIKVLVDKTLLRKCTYSRKNVIDCDTPVIKSSGLHGKKDKVLHKDPCTIKTDIAKDFDTEFSALKGFVVKEFSGLKNLINRMFLKFENEQLVKVLASLRGENLNKILIIKILPGNFCQNTALTIILTRRTS